MRTIIAVTELQSMPGRYQLRVSGTRGGNSEAGRDPGSAAAAAMNAAIQHGGGGYTIFAPDRVLALIPIDMRSKE